MPFVRKIHTNLLILCIITVSSFCIAEKSSAQQCKQYLFYVEASGRTVTYADAIADAMYRFMHTGKSNTAGCTIKFIKNDGYQDGIRGKAKQIRSTVWKPGCRPLDSISREDIAKVLRTMEGNRGEVEGVHTYIGLMNKLKEEVDVAYDKIAVFYSFVCADNSQNFTEELSASTREFHEAASIIEQSGKVTFFELPIKKLGPTEKLIRDDVFKKLPKMYALNEKLDVRESIAVRKPIAIAKRTPNLHSEPSSIINNKHSVPKQTTEEKKTAELLAKLKAQALENARLAKQNAKLIADNAKRTAQAPKAEKSGFKQERNNSAKSQRQPNPPGKKQNTKKQNQTSKQFAAEVDRCVPLKVEYENYKDNKPELFEYIARFCQNKRIDIKSFVTHNNAPNAGFSFRIDSKEYKSTHGKFVSCIIPKIPYGLVVVEFIDMNNHLEHSKSTIYFSYE